MMTLWAVSAGRTSDSMCNAEAGGDRGRYDGCGGRMVMIRVAAKAIVIVIAKLGLLQ